MIWEALVSLRESLRLTERLRLEIERRRECSEPIPEELFDQHDSAKCRLDTARRELDLALLGAP